MSEADVELLHEPPSPEEHVWMRTITGLTPPPPSADIAKALAASVHCITARRSSFGSSVAGSTSSATLSRPPAPDGRGDLVGMVRLTGDGILFCQLTDMAVHPDYQGRGLGKKLLDEMLRWIDEHAPTAYVNLIGDPPGQALYKSRGFKSTLGIGMYRSTWGK